jgi:hypothetical protein
MILYVTYPYKTIIESKGDLAVSEVYSQRNKDQVAENRRCNNTDKIIDDELLLL